MAVEAKGGPLSVRMRRGRPNSRKRCRKRAYQARCGPRAAGSGLRYRCWARPGRRGRRRASCGSYGLPSRACRGSRGYGTRPLGRWCGHRRRGSESGPSGRRGPRFDSDRGLPRIEVIQAASHGAEPGQSGRACRRVDLRRSERTVTQERLDHPQVRAHRVARGGNCVMTLGYCRLRPTATLRRRGTTVALNNRSAAESTRNRQSVYVQIPQNGIPLDASHTGGHRRGGRGRRIRSKPAGQPENQRGEVPPKRFRSGSKCGKGATACRTGG